MLIGQRVRLRANERDDVPDYVRWLNDPEVRCYLMLFEPLSKVKEERWLDAQLDLKDSFTFAIEALVIQEWLHIGACGLNRIDWKNSTAVFGIFIGEKNQWERGYGSEATRLLLRFAFHELNLHRVELEVFDFNTRGIRSYEKLGFHKEGIRRHAFYRDGVYHDVILMGMLRDEFSENGTPSQTKP